MLEYKLLHRFIKEKKTKKVRRLIREIRKD